MRYMALQGDQGSVLFKWIKSGAIMWCFSMGPKSRTQGLESSWGMLSTCPGGSETQVYSPTLWPPQPTPYGTTSGDGLGDATRLSSSPYRFLFQAWAFFFQEAFSGD